MIEMAKVFIFLADGCEETEAVCPADILRRAGNDVTTVSIMGRTEIRGSHGIYFKADTTFEQADYAGGDAFILPGGGEGTQNLASHVELCSLIAEKYSQGKHVAAICAAPSVLGMLGILKGKKATVYPGMEKTLKGAEPEAVQAVTDGNVTTGRGPGAAADFAFELVRVLNGEKAEKKLRTEFVYEK
jgi:4-methyl-5(b-hydroxyethyl)-thiazole monophosphate biosynthesis